MNDMKSEEKSPLLLYMVEPEEDVSKNNKRMYFDKTRLHNLTSGASAVFTEFPSYLGTYWIASALAALIFIMMVLLVISTMSASFVQKRQTRCVASENVFFDNNTIHLVHTEKHMDEDHIELLEEIRRHYPEFKIRLILIQEPHKESDKLSTHMETSTSPQESSKLPTPIMQLSSETTFKKPILLKTNDIRRRRTVMNPDDLSINMGVKRLLDMLLRNNRFAVSTNVAESKNHMVSDSASTCPLTIQTFAPPTRKARSIKTLDDLIKNKPNFYLENTTYEEAFADSPLHNTWPFLNDNLKILAIRIIQLWQYGGISFSLEPKPHNVSTNFSVFERTASPHNYKKISLSSEDNKIYKQKYDNSKLMRFIHGEKYSLENLPLGIVTADDEGLHIVSKTKCHAFFEEILMQLKKAKWNDTVKDVLQKSLKVFCIHMSVDKKYCDMLMKKRG